MRTEPRTAEVRVTMQPWQKELLIELAENTATTPERVARTFLLGGLLAEQPRVQVDLAVYRIQRYAARAIEGGGEPEPEPESTLELCHDFMVSTAQYLRDIVYSIAGGRIARLVDEIARKVARRIVTVDLGATAKEMAAKALAFCRAA